MWHSSRTDACTVIRDCSLQANFRLTQANIHCANWCYSANQFFETGHRIDAFMFLRLHPVRWTGRVPCQNYVFLRLIPSKHGRSLNHVDWKIFYGSWALIYGWHHISSSPHRLTELKSCQVTCGSSTFDLFILWNRKSTSSRSQPSVPCNTSVSVLVPQINVSTLRQNQSDTYRFAQL